jgi:hypothetical protein
VKVNFLIEKYRQREVNLEGRFGWRGGGPVAAYMILDFKYLKCYIVGQAFDSFGKKFVRDLKEAGLLVAYICNPSCLGN